jgi:nitrilase
LRAKGTEAIAATYAIESLSFVLHCTAVISQAGIERMQTHDGATMCVPDGGASAVYILDGHKITENLPETQGIVYTDIDLSEILRSKAFVDVFGHYSRPDLLWLGVDDREKTHVRSV